MSLDGSLQIGWRQTGKETDVDDGSVCGVGWGVGGGVEEWDGTGGQAELHRIK